MSDRIRHRFTGALLLALAALAAIVAVRVAAYRNTVHLIEINRRLSDTGNIIGKLRGLLAAVEHAEARQNKYIISGDERDLNPYRVARQTVEQRLAAVRPSSNSDPAFQRRWRILEPKVRAHLDWLDRIASIRQAGGFDAAAKMVLRDEEGQSLDDIRTLIATLDSSETMTLQEATDEVAVGHRHNLILFLVFSFLDAALLIAGYLLLRHYMHQRDGAESQLMLAKDSAEKANRAKDEFLAMVSHDLRSPLNAIELWLAVLRGGALGSEQLREASDGIERSVRNQARLINDLLDVSRIVHGKFHVERRPMDLVPVLSTVVATMRPAAESKHVALVLESSVDSFAVLGDGARLQQLAWNLLSNAIKFTPSGGRICVRIRQMDQYIDFQVADSGVGIPPGFLPYVFDRFSQSASPGDNRRIGLGLGLAIVKHIVESHEGSVTAQSPGENQGATFAVRLPAIGVAGAITACDERALHSDGAADPPVLAK